MFHGCNRNTPAERTKERRVMTQGAVSWFNDEEGIGFIRSDDGEDVFVHHSSIEMAGHKTLIRGERVSFEVVMTKRGMEARKVRRLS